LLRIVVALGREGPVVGEDQSALPAGIARDLASLRWHYGGAYQISVHRSGKWRAARTDNGERLEAGSAEDLRAKIREDYGRNPVPRH
jgi:hypothetical protein